MKKALGPFKQIISKFFRLKKSLNPRLAFSNELINNGIFKKKRSHISSIIINAFCFYK